MFWKIPILAAALCFCSCTVAERQDSKRSCQLFEYYDPNMDDCAPCREICDHMVLTRTETECKSKCSDYLIAAKCTYRQYYDDVVSACAPCTELCVDAQVKGTAQQCADKCARYLKAQNCTEEEYFNTFNSTCTPCSRLCSQRDEHGDTVPDCFHRCPHYVAKNPPGNILLADPNEEGPNLGDPAQTKTGPSRQRTSSSMHPGIILTIVIGLVAVVATLGLIVYLLRTRRRRYARAPTEGAVEEDEESGAAQMEDPQPPETVRPCVRADSAALSLEKEVKVGVKERDPAASSALCYNSKHSVQSAV